MQLNWRADDVLANDVLREEYAVEQGDPEDVIGEALEHTAKVFGCHRCR